MADIKKDQLQHRLDRLKKYLPAHLGKNLSVDADSTDLLTISIHLTSLRYTLSTYLPRYLVDLISTNAKPGLVSGGFRYGTVMFADVSGFTAMSERLSVLGREGAEEITSIVNDYFDTMLEISANYGGDLLKFGGDALLIFFEGEDGPHRAIATGQTMQAAMDRFSKVKTSQGDFPLRMSIGAGTGSIFLSTLGTVEQMEYAVMGRALANMAQAEDRAVAGQVMVDQATRDAALEIANFSEAGDDFWLLDSLSSMPEAVSDLARDETPASMLLLQGDNAQHLEQCLSQLNVLEALAPFIPAELLSQLVIDPQQPTIPGSHRPVTVMFANFYGIDEIIETLGPTHEGAITEILNAHFETMSRILTRYAGVVNKVDTYAKGHRIMALFGALRAREDDPERAVRAALEMNQVLAQVNEQTRQILNSIPDLAVDFGDSPLKQRIGLNSGFVFAGNVGSSARHEHSVMGDEVNLTARLMSIAEEGEVLVSQSTARHVAETFTLHEKESVKVKGKSKPVRNFAVIAAREQASVWAETSKDSMVGRDEELQLGWQTVEQAYAGDGRILSISGPSGIGKTRLAEEIALHGRMKLGMDILAGSCLSYGDAMAYHPWGDILRDYFNIRQEQDTQTRIAVVQQALDEIGEGVWTPVVGEILHLDIPDNELTRALDAKLRRQRLLDLTLTLLQKRSEQRPLILVMEDCHWADPASMDLINYVCRNISGYPILVMLPHRPDPDLPNWQDYEHCVFIPLEDLSDQASLTIVKRLIGEAALPPALQQLILSKGAGNPFFIEEVVRALIDAGIFEQDSAGNWSVTQQTGALELPDTIHGIIISRVDRLLETDRRILQVASVVGRIFGSQIIDGVYFYGDLDTSLDQHLDYLETMGLTETESQSLERYRFKHMTTREVVYESQAFEQRRNLHRRIANFIERHSRSASEEGDNLAYHYFEGQSWAKAMTYNLAAARRAQREFANDIAVTAYNRTLAAAGKLADSEADTYAEELLSHEALGEVLTLLGRYDEALEHFSTARSMVETEPAAVDQLRHLAELARKTADVFEKRGDYDTAFEWLEQGLGYLDEKEPTIEAARIYLLGAGVYQRQGNYEAAINWCEKSLAAAHQMTTREGKQAAAQADYNLGGIYIRQGDLTRAIESCQESIRVYEEIDDLVGQSQAYINLANAYSDQGDWRSAGESFRTSLRMKEQIGDILSGGIIANNLGNIHLYRGEWDEATKLFEQSTAVWKQVGAAAFEAVTLSNLAQVHIYNANWQAADQALRRSETIFNKVGSEDFLPELERRWAQFYQKTDDLEAAMTHIKRSIELAVKLKARLEEGMSYRVFGQIYMAQNDTAAAKTALTQSAEILADLDSEYERAKTDIALARLAFEASDLSADTQSKLSEAIATFETLEAHADLVEAKVLQQKLSQTDFQ